MQIKSVSIQFSASSLNPKYVKAKQKATDAAKAQNVIDFNSALIMQARDTANSFTLLPLPREITRELMRRAKGPLVYRNTITNQKTGQNKDVRFLFRPFKAGAIRNVHISTDSKALPSRENPLMSGFLQIYLSRGADVSAVANVQTKSKLRFNIENGRLAVQGNQSLIEIPSVQVNPFGSPRTIKVGIKASPIIQNVDGSASPKAITQFYQLSPDGKDTPGLLFSLHHSLDKPSAAKVINYTADGHETVLYDGLIES